MTLKQLIDREDWEGLGRNLETMSNSQFRTAESSIRTLLMSVSNELFWKAYLFLMKYRRQSFITCITSIRHLVRSGELDFDNEHAHELCSWMKENCPEYIPKLMRIAIPLLATEEQMDGLLHCFELSADEQCVAVLMRQDTPLAYYAMFKALRHADNPELVRKCIISLIQRHDDMAFNMASILRGYFGIERINMNFSLRIEPYELNYIDKSFANFNNFLNGRRPVL